MMKELMTCLGRRVGRGREEVLNSLEEGIDVRVKRGKSIKQFQRGGIISLTIIITPLRSL